MNRGLTNLLAAVIPSREMRHRVRDRLNGCPRSDPPASLASGSEPRVLVVHKVYGPIYAPFYHSSAEISSEEPEIYSKNGRRLETFFLRDRHLAHRPNVPAPEYFVFDRFNVGLKTHFYSHEAMLETMGRPDRRYGCLIESEAIVPQDYEIFDRYEGLYKDFDAIFTYSYELLNRIPNAKFVPFCAEPWYGTERGGGKVDDMAYARKTKMVSILSSAKTMCDLHRFRLDLANRCKRDRLADTFGTFDGGPRVKVADTLTDYRYSITIENSFSRYFFTERLTSSLLAMTVPVYCGTSDIGEFFNTDGIISIRPGNDIQKILSQCSEKDYEQRLPAIRDNFQRALKYMNVWNDMYEKYLLRSDLR